MVRRQIRVCHANVRSLAATGRLFDVELLAAAHGMDVLCLSETWLQRNKHDSSMFMIPGFQPPFRLDRPDGRGGGVAVYVRDQLPVQRIALTNCLIECVAIKIHFSKKQMLTILAVYRPPGLSASSVSTFCSHLDGAIDECCSAATQPFCLVGDFNSKHSLWWGGQTSDTAGEALYSTAADHDLTQLIDCPTRLASDSPALLDLVFTNRPDLVSSWSGLVTFNGSLPDTGQLQPRQVRIWNCELQVSWLLS